MLIEITTDSEIFLKINGKEISLKDSSSEPQPECKISPDGSKWWYLNGKLHRTDGPAIERANGSKEWYLNDQYHRVDGPAIEYSNGYKSWYLNGKCFNESEFNNRKNACNGKIVVIDGKSYELKELA